KKIKKKTCDYYILLAKNYFILDNWNNVKKLLKSMRKCKNPEKQLLYAIYNLKRNLITKAQKLINKNINLIVKNINEPFYKKFLYLNAEKLIYYGKYSYLLQVSKVLSENYKEDCDINSWYLIAKIRLGNYTNLDSIFKKVENCKTKWALVADNLYKDLLVERRMRK
ncbi:hypothetical protein, partial [Hydrogenivirga sp. 128-5-R1-1]|uniref:hypothetical protein n=1 Tax=Hydrogenivirga sp. 128-5-R1-1 TaxID=392423 RepID=UPI00015F0BDD